MIVVIFSALISVVLAADPQRCSCGPNKYMATIMTLAADSSLSKPGDSSTKTVSHLSRVMGKPTMWFPNRSDTNRAVHVQKNGKRLEILDLESRGIVLSM